VLGYGVGFEHVFLRVGSEALKRKLGLLIDAPVRRDIEFNLAGFGEPAMLSGLRRLVLHLAEQLDDADSQVSPLAMQEIGQALIIQLLLTARHNFSGMLAGEPRTGTATHLRRAEDYIEANWNRPILIDDLVQAAGVSARSLFRGFEKQYGCSPMLFVKHLRLRRARELLARAEETTSVTGVALACGFSNLGHFANDYRAAFGELPSDTLRKARRI
jgi:transcriptional regulator GlxA family with amidase domain